MERSADSLVRFIGRLNEWVGRAVSWLTLALVLLVCYDVANRYLFQETKAWFMELEWHLFALIFLLGAGYAFRHDRHVRVDLFYARMPPKDQALVNLVGAVVFLIPWCLLILIVSTRYAWGAWLIREGSPDPGGLPARYLVKFAIPLGAFLLLLQAVASALDAWAVYRGRKRPAGPESGSSLPNETI
ncbi:MAG: TRAP transporter small permease subunit [Saprospiraceae bacterium]|nr:TRAP transporter small permease subunit [Saprospiraceae bacterium]